MQFIKRIRDWWRSFGDDPDFSNTWEIYHISDHVAFMDFVLSQSNATDNWEISMDLSPGTARALQQFAPEGEPIPLTPKTVDGLRSLLPTFDFNSDFVAHTIAPAQRDKAFLMWSYDNLTVCWISKRVTADAIASAAQELGFEYEDTANA